MKNHLTFLRTAAIAVCAAFLLCSMTGCGSDADAQVSADEATGSSTDASISAGRAYLESLEAQDPAGVETALKEIRQQQLLDEREEKLQELENGDVSVWSLFTDYAIMGDSRATGFSVYGFLPEDHVLANKGDHIGNIEDYLEQLKTLNPASIYFCYGLNDITRWGDASDYTAKFTEILAEIRAILPDTKFFINSILPVNEAGQASFTQWAEVPDYNTALQAMCDSIDSCYYIDNSSLAETYASLWAPDGIHFAADFYEHWAANMILAMYDSEYETALSTEET